MITDSRNIYEHLSVYLNVEVKACRSWVTICHTLQSHIVSFNKRVWSNDLKNNVLCGVCAENRKTESQRGDVCKGGGCIKWSVCPQQLTAGTAKTDCVCMLQRAQTSVLVMTNFKIEEMGELQLYFEALDQTILSKPDCFCSI